MSKSIYGLYFVCVDIVMLKQEIASPNLDEQNNLQYHLHCVEFRSFSIIGV